MLGPGAIERMRSEFENRFGAGGADLYFAPGRVNLIGEHTDYNGGLVLPIAIGEGTYLLIRENAAVETSLYSKNLDSAAVFRPDRISRRGDWADYVRGVVLFASKRHGGVGPFDGLFFGDLPLGSGLSSSASIEIATASALRTVGICMEPSESVEVSRKAENEFVGISSGIMDQYTVAFAEDGCALLLDCAKVEHRLVPFNLEDTSILVVHTGVRRSLSDTAYNTRREECERALELVSSLIGPKRDLGEVTPEEFERARGSLPLKLAMRAEHVVRENERVLEAARYLEEGDPENLGRLMNRSHESLRDLFEVSCDELDTLQEIATGRPGVWGCRMTGAGFGGCVIALMRDRYVQEYLRSVPKLYRDRTGCEPLTIVTRPGGGARRLEVNS